MMDRRIADKLFVKVMSQIEKPYEEECNMAIDVFLEEEFSSDELKRMLWYVLGHVKESARDRIQAEIEKEIGSLEDALK